MAGRVDNVKEMAISVRSLVEFTLHGEDIRPANFRDMQEGTLGHKARQKSLQDGWKSEVPLELTVSDSENGIALLVRGRMDAYFPGNELSAPKIEEMKLAQGSTLPEEPYPAHFAQAACYAYMLMANDTEIAETETVVAYISSKGIVRKSFSKILDRAAAEEIFMSFVKPYLQWQKIIADHLEERNKSIRLLKFPYDSYRDGQREMSVQVYTAICRGKRLFAQMPTGTGKSMASIFPAVKALGEGKTQRIYYLTSRTTQRKSPLEALALLKKQNLNMWTLVINAKEKQCPTKSICSLEFCPRAKGHYLRDSQAINELAADGDFSPEKISAAADKYQICPFELSLTLSEIADFTVCDYNYALDPKVHIQRIFDSLSGTTLLIDEAHNLPSRLQDMTSARLNAEHVRQLRSYLAKHEGRKGKPYNAMTEFLNACNDLVGDRTEAEGEIAEIPRSFEESVYSLMDGFSALNADNFSWGILGDKYSEVIRGLIRFKWVMEGDRSNYAFIFQGRRAITLTAFALDVSEYFRDVTEHMSGTVCFSATLSPLSHTKMILGGCVEDATFAMPSPFPAENLLVMSRNVDTRYQSRENTSADVAKIIDDVYMSSPGHYITFFPSFKYMEQVCANVTVPYQMQEKNMSDEERDEFLAGYTQSSAPIMSLCVMGGVFSEGIDLPGDALTGVIIVGVGMPQVNIFQEKMMDCAEKKYGNGFLHTYVIPGMQKVTQAVGRVIRTENDTGVAILVDSRYSQGNYRRLCPEEWHYTAVDEGLMNEKLSQFWNEHGR